MDKKLKVLKGGLIVSSQAPDECALCRPPVLAAMALAAAQSGAAGLRLNGAQTVRLTRKETDKPIIGLFKDYGYKTYITPTFAHAKKIADAGADIIALDATLRREDLAEVIKRIHEELGKLVCADLSSIKEGERAAKFGADLLASTLSGYTGGKPQKGPDFKLVAALSKLGLPVMAEGRYSKRSEVLRALKLGAHCVCVGTAITRPDVFTKNFLP
jgi:putative N-acetylmannosamine-6-phosphate epimerase